MSGQLLLVTLGPVQEFIAQARRTRDLWYGSHLLSELSRAAARALVGGRARLVFPALDADDPELEPCAAPLRDTGQPPRSIANKLLAEVPETVDARLLAQTVRDAVRRFWREEVAAPVRQRCAGLLADGVDAAWTEQVDTFLEFAATWAALGEYAATRRELEGELAARKVLRDFPQWTRQRGAVPKSSLDGARDTVLRPPETRAAELVRRYRIGDGEQLDAVGLVKRAGGEPDQFVPIVNVALASWFALAAAVASSEVRKLQDACRLLDVPRVERRDLPCARDFGFDASVVLPGRWRPLFRELGLDCDAEAWAQQFVRPLLGRMSEPYPYVACLVADGDRMGRAIDRLGTADAHREFSKRLARFAAEDVRRIVEQEHRGALVYAGGDDVLAFLPLPEALACADELQKAFAAAMASACGGIPDAERPTLSVGLGVGHVMEGMGDLLGLGRRAEREAKRDRNALAVIIDKRSGGERVWKAAWGDDPVRVLRDAMALLEQRLPARKVYEIANARERLPGPDPEARDCRDRALALEVRRSLARVEGGALTPEAAGLELEATAGAGAHERVREWVGRMLVARTFLQAEPRERREGEEEAAA